MILSMGSEGAAKLRIQILQNLRALNHNILDILKLSCLNLNIKYSKHITYVFFFQRPAASSNVINFMDPKPIAVGYIKSG